MCYDGLLLMAVLLVASALALMVNRGEPVEPGNPLMSGYLLGVTFVFFAWFWTHGGQTLGMKAWRLKLVHLDGSPLTWRDALLRFLTALPAWCVVAIGVVGMLLPESTHLKQWSQENLIVPGGAVLSIGMVWVLYDNSRLSWRDRFTHTRVVLMTKHLTGAS